SQRPVQTPQEYADELGSRVPPVRQGLNRLATIFGRARFSPRPLDPEEETEANEVWRASRVDLLKGAAAQRLPRRRQATDTADES
ncbi:MAG TPA: DUF4129 domain-containing protein, partial [Ardenticatenaceae bacterium]|nr:DUF4129 domain-containing protein [Ardenticatenaceae bacterium]